MPIRKIRDLKPACSDPDHDVPSHMHLDNGVYEHVCSGCGKKNVFVVNKPTLSAYTPPKSKECFCYGHGGHPGCPFED